MEYTNFVFIIPVFNCEDIIQKTLFSVLQQDYPYWKIMIRSDQSTDRTPQRIEDFIKTFNLKEKINLVCTERKMGEVENYLEASKLIDDNEVICRLDGGDWLTNTSCLVYLDQYYKQHEPAIVWTKQDWAYHPEYNISGPLPHGDDTNVYRDLLDNWKVSHLKTWRKKEINDINDLNYRWENGQYAQIGCDRYCVLPILHKAGLEKRKRLFLPIYCYHYSIDLSNPNLFTEERSIRQRKSVEYLHKRGFLE